MNELQIFNSEEFGEIRTVNINGEPWLAGKDVAVALGYTNPQKAMKEFEGMYKVYGIKVPYEVLQLSQQTNRASE